MAAEQVAKVGFEQGADALGGVPLGDGDFEVFDQDAGKVEQGDENEAGVDFDADDEAALGIDADQYGFGAAFAALAAAFEDQAFVAEASNDVAGGGTAEPAEAAESGLGETAVATEQREHEGLITESGSSGIQGGSIFDHRDLVKNRNVILAGTAGNSSEFRGERVRSISN